MNHDMNPSDENVEPRRIPVRDWLFRFDTPPTPLDISRSALGDLFQLLQLRYLRKLSVAKPPERDERREDARYVPNDRDAMVGWWRGAEFVVLDALIQNLSQGGTLLELSEPPNRSQPIWVCLGQPKLDDLAQARVLDVAETASGAFSVRLLFHTPCPPAFLEAAGERATD